MGMVLSSSDAYINVVGGLKLDEPATDLPILLAVASAFKNKPISEDTAAFGEVGLAGELRAVNATEQRLSEIYRLGFKKCIIPFHKNENIIIPEGLEVIRVSNIEDAVNAIM